MPAKKIAAKPKPSAKKVASKPKVAATKQAAGRASGRTRKNVSGVPAEKNKPLGKPRAASYGAKIDGLAKVAKDVPGAWRELEADFEHARNIADDITRIRVAEMTAPAALYKELSNVLNTIKRVIAEKEELYGGGNSAASLKDEMLAEVRSK